MENLLDHDDDSVNDDDASPSAVSSLRNKPEAAPALSPFRVVDCIKAAQIAIAIASSSCAALLCGSGSELAYPYKGLRGFPVS